MAAALILTENEFSRELCLLPVSLMHLIIFLIYITNMSMPNQQVVGFVLLRSNFWICTYQNACNTYCM